MQSETKVQQPCVAAMKATSNGVLQGDNPLDHALPLAILQICLVLALSRGLAFLLRPMRQPRVIAECLGGILLGPSAFGRSKVYLNAVFPPHSLTVLDTLANIGLLLFLFVVGIGLDIKSLRRTGKQTLGVAVAGISAPFALGIGTSFLLRQTISKGADGPPFHVFMGVALSVTAFPVLACILAELNLLTTKVGQMAMSAAAVNDVAAWILLALAIALSGSGNSPLVCLWVFLLTCGFVAAAVVIFHPIFSWMDKKCSEGESVNEIYICATLAAVLAAGFVTDTIGIHALFGAFVLGAVVPNEGPFADALVEKVNDLVSGLFLPLYFASSGLKTNMATIKGLQSWGLLVLVTSTACVGKILGTVAVSLAFKMPRHEAFALGFLMNSKGLVELIVLNIGKDRKVLNDQTFAIMILMAIFTTFITPPLVMAIYKPARKASSADYMHRTIERKDSSTQLRLLVCFHSTRNIPTIINLIESSRGIERHERLRVYAMHLMELSQRSADILIMHKARKKSLPLLRKGQQKDKDHVVVAFETFQKLSGVSIRPMTSISALSDMHKDICTRAEQKRVAMVILPFHKHQRVDGVMEMTRAEYRGVNQRVLEEAPCSVGILIDCGLGGTTHVSASNVSYSVTVLFFGGCDDREALSYGARMAEHPGIKLTVIHCAMEPPPVEEIVFVDINGDSDNAAGGSAEDHFLAEFKAKTVKNSSVQYDKRFVKNAAETIAVIQEFSQCSLFLVGRDPEGVVAAALDGKGDCPELGPVGNFLTSPGFTTRASVLVVQQHGKVKY